MHCQYLVQFRLFLQVGLVDGFHFPRVQCIDYLCGIFLDDISTREQFVFFWFIATE